MRIEKALERYVVQLEAGGRSPHTIKQAQRHVRMFAMWGKREIEAVDHEVVAQFLASSAVRQRSDGQPRIASSANAIRGSIKSFLRFVHEAGYAPTNAGRLIRRARTPPPPPKALSDTDAAKLVRTLDDASTPVNRRDRALFTLLLRAGLRLGSATALDVEDVDLDRGVLRLRSVKNGGESTAIVPDDVVKILRDHVGERTTGPLFRASHGGRVGARHVRRRLAEWAERSGIGPVHPHQLRHSFGQHVYARSRDIVVVASAMNHRSISSSQAYVRADSDMVRRAIG